MRASPGVNRSRLLAQIIAYGPLHRADAARSLGVSRTTVTNLTRDLVAQRILTPVDGASTSGPDGGSRLKERLGLHDACGVVVSIVFQATATAQTVATLDGRVVASSHEEFEPDIPGTERLDLARNQYRSLLSDRDIDPSSVLYLCAAVNTQIDGSTGTVVRAPSAGTWAGTSPRQHIETWTEAPIALENTARLTGLAEYLALPEPRPTHLVYVHLAWGVTLGQIVDGAIVTGSHGGAGEIGHVSVDRMGLPCSCGNRGCLMNYVGLTALSRRFEAVVGPGHDVRDVLTTMDGEDHALAAIVAEAGEVVGDALATVCNLLDPDAIVLGGELADVGEPFLASVRRSLRRRALPLTTQQLALTQARVWADPAAITEAAIARLRADGEMRSHLTNALLQNL